MLKILKLTLSNFMFLLSMIYLLFNPLGMFSYSSGMMNFYGMDSVSFILIILVFWIFGICYMMANSFKLLFLFFILKFSLIMCFYSLSLIMMYFWFEVSMIPIFLMILMFGVSKYRFIASMYLFFYTLFFSVPFLILLFKINNLYFSMNFFLLSNMKLSGFSNLELIFFLMVFMIKLPIFGFHLWLPKAHVEAPVFGSMILASIMLKLGGYGLVRMIFVLGDMILNVNLLFIEVGLLGGIMCSITIVGLIDMKMIIAYSSVVHMNLLMSGLMSLKLMSYYGSMIMMISHGLTSSGLFYLVNVNYSRSGSRLLLLSKSFLIYCPYLILMWFSCIVSNMSAPLYLGLFGEVLLFSSLISFCSNYLIYLMILSILGAFYSLYLFTLCHHSSSIGKFCLFNSGLVFEYLISLYHVIPMIFLMLNFSLLF